MIKKLLKIAPFLYNMKNDDNEKLFTKLIKGDTQFSSVNFFLIMTTCVGILLLIVPIIGLSVDIIYNHTITIDLNGLSAYIISVAGIFGAAGITNAWTEYSYNKYHRNIFSETNTTNNITNNTINNSKDNSCVDEAIDSVIDN